MKKLSLTALGEELQHQGMCDASAAIAVGNSDYLIVANDEDIAFLFWVRYTLG
jgi:hypothetical protein